MRNTTCFAASLLTTSILFSQQTGLPSMPATTSVPSPDVQAQSLLSLANQAVAQNTAIHDVKLVGNATWTAGAVTETGSTTMALSGRSMGRLDLQLQTESRSEILNYSGPTREGLVIDAQGRSHEIPLHGCFLPAAWFSPWAWLQAAMDANEVVFYKGSENRGGSKVDHISARQAPADSGPTSQLISRLSAFDLYLDASSHLPVAVQFNNHPMNNADQDMPAEIRFSDYRNAEGANFPFRIQRFAVGALELDVSLTGTTINAGVPDTQFQIP